jgi:hypothetical protein
MENENARHHSNAMWRVQAPQLQYNQKQKEYSGQAGAKKVLSVVPASYGS